MGLVRATDASAPLAASTELSSVTPSGTPTARTPLAGTAVLPVSVTSPTSLVIPTRRSLTSGEPLAIARISASL